MKKLLKWVGIVVAVALVLVAITGFMLMQSGKSKAMERFEVTGLLESAPSDSATLARGLHIAQTRVCHDCHGEALEGKVFADAPPFRMVAPNLTSGKGGVAASYRSISDWDRSIRYGVRPNGTALLIMPARAFHHLSDTDAAALIAYVRSMPPVDNELPAREIRPLGNVLLGAGALDIAMEVRTQPARKAAPPEGATPEYGEYIIDSLCAYCHGDDLGGGPALEPGTPPPPSLAAASAWPLDQFATAIRTGIAPGGRQLNAQLMPTMAFSHFTDQEIEAVHRYLQQHFGTSM
ncbi:MAG: cytochrome c [Rhodothermales bacterium]